MGRKGKLISDEEAAKRLGVAKATVREWVRRGRLKGRIREIQVIKEEFEVDPASFANAFKARCLHCGELFDARHPEMAKFCSSEHREEYHAARKS